MVNPIALWNTGVCCRKSSAGPPTGRAWGCGGGGSMNRSIGVAAVLSIAVLAAGANSIYASRLQSTEPPESPPSASDSIALEGTVPADVETTTGEAANGRRTDD